MELQINGQLELSEPMGGIPIGDVSGASPFLLGTFEGTARVQFNLVGEAVASGALAIALNGEDRELSTLAVEWKQTRQKTSSSIVKWVLHPAYLRIIGKGRAALPFILRELQREPDHWFIALRALTGEDPVPEEDSGDLYAMAKAWLAWGKKLGYV